MPLGEDGLPRFVGSHLTRVAMLLVANETTYAMPVSPFRTSWVAAMGYGSNGLVLATVGVVSRYTLSAPPTILMSVTVTLRSPSRPDQRSNLAILFVLGSTKKSAGSPIKGFSVINRV